MRHYKTKILKIVFFVFIGISLFLTGCGKEFNNIDEFEQYVKGEDSPYRQTIIKNGVKFSLQYLPTDAVMINDYRRFEVNMQELKIDSMLESELLSQKVMELKESLTSKKTVYDKSLYFSLTIEYTDGGKDLVYDKSNIGFNDFSKWLEKLLFSLKHNIYLETDAGDEIPLSLYHMDRNFGLSKSRTFLLMFPGVFNNNNIFATEEPVKLIIEDFGMGVGNIVFNCDLLGKDTLYNMVI